MNVLQTFESSFLISSLSSNYSFYLNRVYFKLFKWLPLPFFIGNYCLLLVDDSLNVSENG